MKNVLKNGICVYVTVILFFALLLPSFNTGKVISPAFINDSEDTFSGFEPTGSDVFENEKDDIEYLESVSDSAMNSHENIAENADVEKNTHSDMQKDTQTQTEKDDISLENREETDENVAGFENGVTESDNNGSGVITAFKHTDYSANNSSENIYDLYFFSENIGSLPTFDSINTYTFTLESRCSFRYTVTHDKLGLLEGWRVELYQEYYVNGVSGEKSYRLLNTLKTNADTTSDSSVELGLMPGAYRLVVSSGSKYTSELYKIDVVTKENSDFEIECNDNIYRYTEIFGGVSIKGSASYFDDRQDEDWYLLRVYNDGFSSLSFKHPSVKDKTTVCWQVILYSEDGTVLFSVNSLFTDTLIESGEMGLSAGNYYILVRNRVYTDITYTLEVTKTDDENTESEPNDTFTQANQIGIDSVITGAISAKADTTDKDYYVFSVTKNGYVVIEFSHTPISDSDDKNGWNITLYDKNGTVIYKGVSAWADDVTASVPIGLASGTYYIRIDSDNLYHTSEKYYLSVSFSQHSDWESEPNNSMASADGLTADVIINGVLADMGTDFDYDWYSFTLDNQKNVSVNLSHEVLSYSKNIFTFTLYNSDGNVVKTSTGQTNVNSSASDESVSADFAALPAGKYYIRVTPGLFYDNISYLLKYSVY